MRVLRAFAPVIVVISVLVTAQAASARYDPIGAGSTKLTLAKPFAALLQANGVGLSATGGATFKAGVATFPISGGKLEPVAVVGSVEHEGALVFRVGRRSLPLKSLTLKTTQAHSPLTAKFGGGQLKIAASATLSSRRSGFGVASKVTQIKLSAKAAERLDKKLDLRGVFKEGQLLGSSLTDAQPASVAIMAGGSAELTLEPEFAAKLASLFVAVNPILPAEHLGTPFTLPITGGQIATDASSGTLETSGGLEAIQQDGGQLTLANLWPDLGGAAISLELDALPSPPLAGRTERGSGLGYIAGLTDAEPNARTITVTGATATLAPATAQVMNEAFASPQGKAGVFNAGEALGTISYLAQAQ
jgi:hypothetical protein